MFCQKCGNEIKEGEKFCSNCGQKILEETLNKNNKKTKIIIFLLVVCIIFIIMFGLIYPKKDNIVNKDFFESTSVNVQAIGVEKVSFNNLNADDENLDEIQKNIVNYFDNDYFYCEPTKLQMYPQLFEDSKIKIIGGVMKVLKSTDDEFEVLMYEDSFGYQFGQYPTAEPSLNENSRLFILKGSQLSQRLIVDDYIDIRGRYEGVETREIDGVLYTVPVINAINVSYCDEDTFNISTIRSVANYIFGNDIKISQPEHNILNTSYETNYYLVTLDNQSNANFKSFNMSKDRGLITYNEQYNNLSNSVTKKLSIASDFNHFIVSTYDNNLKYIYIDYFDKELNKVWSREFQFNSDAPDNFYDVYPMDYNSEQMVFVIDNDLYLIDIKTGENIVNPVLVGKKTKVIMMSDGIILLGEENKDLVMKVDFDGKILYRIDGDSDLTQIYSTSSQIVEGRLLLIIDGINENASEDLVDEYYIQKYMVIKNDGTIEYATRDFSGYNG